MQKTSREGVSTHGNSLSFCRVLAGPGGILLWERRRMCRVAAQGMQIKLDELFFDTWQRVGYSRHREQSKHRDWGNV